jgi:hypothetical protein
MPRTLRIPLILLFSLVTALLPAQTSTFYGTSGESVILPDMPFHAERVTHAERKLADDTIESREQHETIDRDSSGRVLVESTVLSSGGIPTAKPSVFHELLDPVAGTSYNWNTLSTNAMTQHIGHGSHIRITAGQLAREENITPPKDGPANEVVVEDLGQRTIAGLPAFGKRITTTIPAARFGTSKPLVVTQEVWTSPEFQMTVLEIDKSPFTGTRTSEITRLSRTEPDAALFHLPDGYTTKSFLAGGVGGVLGAKPDAPPAAPKSPLP